MDSLQFEEQDINGCDYHDEDPNNLCQLTMKLSVLLKDPEEVGIMCQLNSLYKSSLIQLNEQINEPQEDNIEIFSEEDAQEEPKGPLSEKQQLDFTDNGTEKIILKTKELHLRPSSQNQEIKYRPQLERQDNFELKSGNNQQNNLNAKDALRIHNIHKQYLGIKEGYLYKKSNGLVGLFEKKFFILTNSRLFYFSDEQKMKIQGVINFKIAKCSVNQPKERHLTVQIQNYEKSYILRAETKGDAEEWFDLIQSVIYENIQPKTFIKTTNLKIYFESDSLTEEEFVDFAETGDILLFSTNNIAAKLQRGLTGSKYDHVGMVIKFQNQEIRIFDSSFDNGVALLRWYDFIEINDLFTKVTLRKLVYNRRYEIEPTLIQFVGENLGRKYLISAKKLLKKQSIHKRDPKEGYFCSELVAQALKQCKLLDPIKSSCQYWPVDFSQEKQLQLLKGAKLSNEIMIILKKHRYL